MAGSALKRLMAEYKRKLLYLCRMFEIATESNWTLLAV